MRYRFSRDLLTDLPHNRKDYGRSIFDTSRLWRDTGLLIYGNSCQRNPHKEARRRGSSPRSPASSPRTRRSDHHSNRYSRYHRQKEPSNHKSPSLSYILFFLKREISNIIIKFVYYNTEEYNNSQGDTPRTPLREVFDEGVALRFQ